ncbi:hypothetical protein QJS10_CPB04g00397 [Acorus calamus]|uniref:Uncharacterized protein n=1 Tax=Acorus calamus TaxID=4465 RepID=A0AAV9EX87_ACOCL|nr:hypothetical protein QJS10_CPB04g00397 [Acorus calamus]
MVRRLYILSLFAVLMLVSAKDIQPVGEVLSPTPSAQPTTFPMYGVTQGSLHPQECSPRCAMRCSKTQYRKPCCSSARNAARNACACRRGLMGTSSSAHAMITGRPREVDPSVLRCLIFSL